MPLVISSEETFFHKATRMIVIGEDTAVITPASNDPDDESVDIEFVNTRVAWIAIKEMATDGVKWYGRAVR